MTGDGPVSQKLTTFVTQARFLFSFWGRGAGRRQGGVFSRCLRLKFLFRRTGAQVLELSLPLPTPETPWEERKSAGKRAISSFAYAGSPLERKKKRRQASYLFFCLRRKPLGEREKAQASELSLLLPTPEAPWGERKSAGKRAISSFAYAGQFE